MFEVSLTPSALEDLRFFKKTEQKEILASIEAQLSHEPLKRTRNRKPLRENELCSWEVRVGGEFRVFYDVDEDEEKVTIKAIGRKEHNQLFIRGKEYEL